MICSGLCRFLPLVVIEDLLAQTGLKTFITPGSDFQKQANNAWYRKSEPVTIAAEASSSHDR
jgi:hypothetical protein